MSDFDKEAEREKLREKYERDKADREATQRMSDLLLKGATMTNTHCNVCGDPLFRQDGATFCPSCHGGPEGVNGEFGQDPQEPVPDDEESPADSAAEAARDAVDDSAAADDSNSPESPPSPAQPDRTDAQERPGAQRSPDPPQPATEPSGERDERPPAASSDSSAPSVDAGGPERDGDLESARESLVRALAAFSRRAAETDDPRYARDCLEAAHEAADALAALEH